MMIKRNPPGEPERDVDIDDVHVPNLSGFAFELSQNGFGHEAYEILETWHIAMDLLEALKSIRDAEVDAET